MSRNNMVTGAESPACIDLANAISDAIIKATMENRLGLDVAVCVVASVAADYARGDIGDHYLEDLAEVVRANHAHPTTTPIGTG